MFIDVSWWYRWRPRRWSNFFPTRRIQGSTCLPSIDPKCWHIFLAYDWILWGMIGSSNIFQYLPISSNIFRSRHSKRILWKQTSEKWIFWDSSGFRFVIWAECSMRRLHGRDTFPFHIGGVSQASTSDAESIRSVCNFFKIPYAHILSVFFLRYLTPIST